MRDTINLSSQVLSVIFQNIKEKKMKADKVASHQTARSTLNEMVDVLEKIYRTDKARWASLKFVDAFMLAAHPQKPGELTPFTDSMHFLDMEDEEFFNTLYDLPIAISGMPVSENSFELNDFHTFSDANLWAYAIAPFLYEPTHTHTYFEIDCIMSGSCDLFFEDTHRILTENDLIIITPGSKHQLIARDRNCRAIRLLLKKQFFDDTFFDILSTNKLLSGFFATIFQENDDPNYLLFDISGNVHIRKNIKTIMYETYIYDEFSDRAAVAGMNMMFCHLIRNHSNIYSYNNESRRSVLEFPRMLNYIRSNYKTVTLGDLAKEFHYSTAHISRCFKEFTGQNYVDIIHDIRLEKTKELLGNTPMSISDITEFVGFSAPSYLSRAFKKKYGVSPQAYRKQTAVE